MVALENEVDLKAALVRRAYALGFASCRVTRCAPPPHGEEFRQWLRDGAAGEMDWLSARCGKAQRSKSDSARSAVSHCRGYELLAGRSAAGKDRQDRALRLGRRLSRCHARKNCASWTPFSASMAANKNVMSIPDLCWNAITRPRRESVGMAKAPCWWIEVWGPGFSSEKYLPRSICRPMKRNRHDAVVARAVLPPARPGRLQKHTVSTRGVAFLI